jgi:hypothetical protein
MKSRASLMRIDGSAQMRGVLMGRFVDAIGATPCDVSWDHYGGFKVQAMRRCTAALRRPQHGIRTRSGTSSEGPRAGKRLHGSRQPDQSWSRHIPRRPVTLCETGSQDR